MKFDFSDDNKRFTIEANHPTLERLDFNNQSIFDVIDVLNQLEGFEYVVEIKEVED